MNPLIPLSHHDEPSKTPAAKSVPVRTSSEIDPDRRAAGVVEPRDTSGAIDEEECPSLCHNTLFEESLSVVSLLQGRWRQPLASLAGGFQ
jgi:hypothetical protein